MSLARISCKIYFSRRCLLTNSRDSGGRPVDCNSNHAAFPDTCKAAAKSDQFIIPPVRSSCKIYFSRRCVLKNNRDGGSRTVDSKSNRAPTPDMCKATAKSDQFINPLARTSCKSYFSCRCLLTNNRDGGSGHVDFNSNQASIPDMCKATAKSEQFISLLAQISCKIHFSRRCLLTNNRDRRWEPPRLLQSRSSHNS